MKELIRDFLSSKKYMFLLSLITIVTWLFNAPMIALFFSFLSISLIYLFKAKEGALLCSIFMIFAGAWTIHFDYYEIKDIIGLILLVPTIIFALYLIIKDIIMNKKKYSKRIKDDYVLYSLFLIIGAMILSLLSYTCNNVPISEFPKSIGYIASLLPTIIFAFVALFKIDIKKCNLDNILFPFVIIIYTIFIQMMLRLGYISYSIFNERTILSSDSHFIFTQKDYILFDNFFENLKEAISKKEVSLFWELCNHFVALTMMSLSMTIYLLLKTKDRYTKLLSILAIIMALIIFILSTCRASWLGVASIVVLFIYVIINNYFKEKYVFKLNVIFTSILCLCVIAGLILLLTKKISFDLNGRDYLYDKAKDVFYRYPLIGAGAGTSHYQLIDTEGGAVYNYHNLFLQSASDTGIIGLITLIIFIIAVSFRIYNNKSLFSYFVMFSFIYLLSHGLVDNVIHNQIIMPFLIYIIMLLPKENNQYITLYGYKNLIFE